MQFWKKLSVISIVFSTLIIITRLNFRSNIPILCNKEYNSPGDFDGFDNETGTENGCEIVPNFVHFIRYKKPEFTFVEAICVLAALKNQKPDLIFFHTDTKFKGKYWEYLLEQDGFQEKLRIVPSELPKEVYGQRLSPELRLFHGSDVSRIQILMKYGGIFIENDCFIVKSLKPFFKYEITMGWEEDQLLANQVIIANKNARFLRKYILSYKAAYNGSLWYYNAGVRPTQILDKNPQLIHREKKYLNDFQGILELLYLPEERTENWKNHFVLHLLVRYLYLYPESDEEEKVEQLQFDEFNLYEYPITFHDMVESVYPYL